MKKCDILIIDDDDEDVEILSDAFKKIGLDKMHYEQSAEKALIYLKGLQNSEDLPKIIITDYYLSGSTGVDFIKLLKGLDAFKHIPVIVLSMQRTEKEIQKFIEMGAADYLVKPSTYDDYLKLVGIIKAKIVVQA
ncbi:MAG TPA: response regulator [Chitinophagaceae bacterium]|nr:response regulator [Chitinophagaceae bacterium]